MTRLNWKVSLAFAALLIPVYWHPRIQSVDLPSHVYNAWLSLLVEKGQAPGLALFPQWTNVMFDVILVELMRHVGSEWAERLAVSFAVLVFNTGFFLLLRQPRQEYPWALFPLQAMFSYGWVYHAGLFNFYLSLGLSLIALSSLIRPLNARRLILAASLLAAAVLAHALPVLWAAGIAAYFQLARSLRVKGRLALTGAGACTLVLLGWYLRSRYPTRTELPGLDALTGVDQLIVYHASYRVLALLVLVWWVLHFGSQLDRVRPLRLLASPLVQAILLSATCVVAIPSEVKLPAYQQSLAFISERMSLTVAVLVLAWLGRHRLAKWEAPASCTLASVFFALLYFDSAWANRVERGLTETVRRLPPDSRVVSGLRVNSWRLDPTLHQIDRACLGWCFSYGDYEPLTHQFRLRAVADSPILLAGPGDRLALEFGYYHVRPRDLPLYQIILLDRQNLRLGVRELKTGDRVGLTRLDGTQDAAKSE